MVAVNDYYPFAGLNAVVIRPLTADRRSRAPSERPIPEAHGQRCADEVRQKHHRNVKGSPPHGFGAKVLNRRDICINRDF
jgi:hypothetical protein